MDWSAFHFLRPLWLLMLFPTLALSLLLWRNQDPAARWKKLIAAELLPHLLLEKEQQPSRLAPEWLLPLLIALGAVALAGPSWTKEPAPFSEDQAAIFLVVESTPSMNTTDLQPDRLQRATYKIDELLKLRQGVQSGLIAYAGSSHLVVPLTSDPDVIRYFVSELDPSLMPLDGDDTAEAVHMAAQRIVRSGLAGSVILFTDYVDSVQLPLIESVHSETGVPVHVYAITAVPDRDALEAAADAGGGSLVVVTPDDADLQDLDARLQRSIARAPTQEGQRWKDAGYYLLWPLLLLTLPFFRRAGALRWR